MCRPDSTRIRRRRALRPDRGCTASAVPIARSSEPCRDRRRRRRGMRGGDARKELTRVEVERTPSCRQQYGLLLLLLRLRASLGAALRRHLPVLVLLEIDPADEGSTHLLSA